MDDLEQKARDLSASALAMRDADWSQEWQAAAEATQAWLTSRGFELWRTGGNCVAMVLRLSGFDLVATSDDGGSLPTCREWYLGAYFDEEWQTACYQAESAGEHDLGEHIALAMAAIEATR